MIVDERMVAYINSLDMGNTPVSGENPGEKRLKDRVPIIRREMQSFLKGAAGTETSGKNFGSGDGSGFFRPSVVCEYAPEGAACDHHRKI